jgi:hypothetical protein
MVLATSKGWVIAATIKPEVLPATRLVELETDCFVPVGILKGCTLLGVGVTQDILVAFSLHGGRSACRVNYKISSIGLVKVIDRQTGRNCRISKGGTAHK